MSNHKLTYIKLIYSTKFIQTKYHGVLMRFKKTISNKHKLCMLFILKSKKTEIFPNGIPGPFDMI